MTKLHKLFRRNTTPAKRSIYRIVNYFEERGSVGDRPNYGLQCTARSAKNLTAAQESVQKSNPFTSNWRHSQELGQQKATKPQNFVQRLAFVSLLDSVDT